MRDAGLVGDLAKRETCITEGIHDRDESLVARHEVLAGLDSSAGQVSPDSGLVHFVLAG